MNKYYAIKRGREKNVIVRSWGECKKLVHKYPSAKYKSFFTKKEAQDYLTSN
ncbi:MAG: viroplasmin family protein [Culicoidibacterales bacterium]